MKNLLLIFFTILSFLTFGQISYSQNWSTGGLNSWTSQNGTFSRTTTSVCSTTGSVRANLFSTNVTGNFASPLLTGNNSGLVTVSYLYKIINYSGGAATPATFGTLKVQYASALAGPWTDVPGSTVNSSNHSPSTSCQTKVVQFTPSAGNVYIRFNVVRSAGDYYMYFDDVTISQGSAPSCTSPTSLTSSSIATTTATISWVVASPAPSNGYQYFLSTSSSAPTTGTTPTGSTAAGVVSVNLSSLNSGTQYYFWVRSNCGGSQSSWAGSSTFTTTIPPPSNDNCSAATSLPCATSNLAGTTVNSVSETAPGGGGLASNFGVWYTFTGDGGQTTLSATGNSFDIEMTIVSGTCTSNTLISSQDNGNPETYTFTTTNSTVYYVYIAHWSSGGTASNVGTFTISRTCVAPCTTPTTAGTLTASKTSTTVNDAVVFTTSGNGGSITKFEYSYDNFSTVEGTVNNPANPYTLILNVQQPTMWFRTTSVSGACPAGVTTPISVTLQSAPEYIYGTEDGDYISNVTLNTINNNSTYDSPLGDSYQDFTSISTTLVKGTNYTIYVSSPATFLGYPSGYAAWIDYNNDGIFQTTENIMQQSYGTTKSQSFTVPTTASVALVTMRVLSSWAETPTTDAYDVIGYDYGEIEEYKINITSGLPVELYSFDGVNVGNNNYLFWVTSSEQNTSHFNLQKSRDGENWNTITTINAAGNSINQIDYDVTDYKVEPIINYYRLQQYDNDGVYEIFGPISINNMNLGETKTVIKYINLNGQEIDPNNINLMDVYIEVYDDGTMRRVIK